LGRTTKDVTENVKSITNLERGWRRSDEETRFGDKRPPLEGKRKGGQAKKRQTSSGVADIKEKKNV